MKKKKTYPDSGVELSPFVSKHYDRILAIASMGFYPRAIKQSIRDMQILPDDHILDLGCGTGHNAALMSDYLDQQGGIHGLDISD